MDKLTLGTRNISIEFPGVKALTDVTFEVSTGEIRAVVGANGAGKSTLMKILAGANPDYTGEVYLNDKVIELRTAMAAKKHGIQIVYQEVDTALVPTLSVAENVMLSNMVMDSHDPMIHWTRTRRKAREILERLHINVNVRKLVQNLTLAQKQMVLIAKAIASECNFLILDEPTAPLSDTETAELFRLVKHLQETENIAIIFISHRINEVLQICEKYTVMRNGEIVDTSPVNAKTTTKEIVEKMLGRTFEELFTKEPVTIGDKVFEVSHLSGADGKVDDVSFYVRKGEIVGIAGLVGAGKSELCKTIFGAYKKTSGTITLYGKELKINIPTDAVKHRLALVPEERRKEGVLVNENVTFNLSAACMDRFCTFSFINKRKADANARHYVKDLGISTPSIKQYVKNLSGGNQQKVLLARWLAMNPKLLILDEPTRGIDVGAKAEIQTIVKELADQGLGVLMISSELEEVIEGSDRVFVLRDGRNVGELTGKKITEAAVMAAMAHGDHLAPEENA